MQNSRYNMQSVLREVQIQVVALSHLPWAIYLPQVEKRAEAGKTTGKTEQ